MSPVAWLILALFGYIAHPLVAMAVLVVLCAAVFALTWAASSLPWRVRRSHRDGCPCGPCRSFDAARQEACAVAAEVAPGLPRDGKRLTRREARALRGIETAARNEREGAGL